MSGGAARTTLRTRAVVLRRTNYGEADRILQLITPEGRVSVLAKSVRKEKSRLAGGIELFAVCDVTIHQGRGELGILTSARLVQYYRHIVTEYDRMEFAYELLRQVAVGSESLDEAEWYDIAVEVLMALDAPTVPLSLVQTWFYIRMSALLGYELNLQRDIGGQKLQIDQRYRYDVTEKGFVSSPQGDITADHIKLLRLIAVKPLQTIVQVGGVAPILHECVSVARNHAALH